MNRHARLSAVLDAMGEQGHADVHELAKRLKVSPSTIRRDLNDLQDQQLVTRTRGGAVATTVKYDLPIRYRNRGRRTDKARIGQAAAELVGVSDIVGLNGGTTTTEVARALATRAAPGGAPEQLTVVTNAINIAGELTVRGHIKIVVTGGVARPQSFELTGPLAYDTLSEVDLDWALLGVDAFDPVDGAKAFDADEARVNRRMAERAKRVVIVADSSKLNARSFARICPVRDVDYLVSDRQAPADAVALLRDAGVRVILV